MKIRFVLVALVLAAASSACGHSPVATERSSTPSARFDGTTPPPDTTAAYRGGGAVGSGN